MSCERVRDALRRGTLPADADFLAHLERCEGCAALLADDHALGAALAGLPPPAPPPEVVALGPAVTAAVAGEAGVVGRLRALATPLRVSLAVVAVVLVTSVVLIALPRPDLGVYPRQRLVLEVAALVLLFASGLRFALSVVHRPPTPRWQLYLALATLVGVPVFLAAAPVAHVAHPSTIAALGEPVWPHAGLCWSIGTFTAAVPVLGLLWALDRREQRGWALAATAAGTAGVAGLLELTLLCPITLREHLLAGHATVVLALVLIGLGVGAARDRRSPTG